MFVVVKRNWINSGDQLKIMRLASYISLQNEFYGAIDDLLEWDFG
jgi:hypothetical protein